MVNKKYADGIFNNAKSSYLRVIVGAGISFLSSVVYARGLGTELYGQYSYVMWFVLIMTSILGFGLTGTITRFLPKYYVNNDKRQAKLMIEKFICNQIIVVGIISIILLICIPIWSKLIKGNKFNVYILLIIVILNILPSILNDMYVSTIQALQKFDVIAKITINVQIVAFIVNCIVVLIFKNIELIILTTLISILYQNYAYYKKIKKFLSIEKINFFKIKSNLKEKKDIIKYTLYMYINIIWQQIVWTKSEYFFLGMYSGNKELALYGLAFSLSSMAKMIFSPVLNVLNNYFAEIVAKKEEEVINKIIYVTTKYFAVLLFTILSYALIFSNDVIFFVYSSEYTDITNIFLILLSGFVIIHTIGISAVLPFYYDKQKFVIVLGVLASILNIILDIIFIPKYGALGAAVANTIAQVLFTVIQFIYITVNFKLDFPIKEVAIIILVNVLIVIVLKNIYFNIIVKIMVGTILIPCSILIYNKLNIISINEVRKYIKEKRL